MKTNLIVEAEGNSFDITRLEKRVKEEIKLQGVLVKDISSINLYVQPATGLCYYVASVKDQSVEGKIEL